MVGHDFCVEDGSDDLTSGEGEGVDVGEDGGFAAADFLAKLEGGGDAEVGDIVDRCDELEEMDEGRFSINGCWWERGGLVAMGCGEGGVDQMLVAFWDVEDCAASGCVKPSWGKINIDSDSLQCTWNASRGEENLLVTITHKEIWSHLS